MILFKKGIRISFILCISLFLNATPVFAKITDYESLHRFSQVMDIIQRYYVQDTNQKDLLDGAINGMLQSLDPHSNYMTPKEYALLQETTSGEFFGIGAELTLENGFPVVVSPIEDTPAAKAGIQSGDIIMAVDGTPTGERSLTESVALIRGPKGTSVELVILPKGEQQTRTVELKRDAIPYISVKTKELEPGYHWVRISNFTERTTEELHIALEEIKKNELKGIILDVRNNPGGILDQAVNVSDTFLSQGKVVSMRGRENSPKRDYNATAQKTDILDIPIIILVNSGSASASEIVAGALKDHERALLVGETTFGKGSVQNLIPLADGAGIKLTVAFYYTPSGKSIQAEGITPDYEITYANTEEDKKNALFIREKDLTNHLDQNATTAPKEEKVEVPTKEIPELLPIPDRLTDEIKEWLSEDNQLRLGYQLLLSNNQ